MSAQQASTPKQTAGGCLVLIFLLLAIVFIVRAACSGLSATPSSSSSQTPTPAVAPIDVTARQLFSAYQENEVSADNAYKGHSLRVSGVVDSINKDFKDDVYLVLVTPNEFLGVHADLSRAQESQAGTLHKGQRIVLLCEGKGMIVGSPIVGDCSIESTTSR